MNIDFEKGGGLVPVVVQDSTTQQVLMLGYMNAESWRRTCDSGRVTFYSRSRQALWEKGETSGNFLSFVSAALDCDGDTILLQAKPQGPTCHLDRQSCFESAPKAPLSVLSMLESIVDSRLREGASGSYVAGLAAKGIERVAQKVGEEGVEVVIEALRGDTSSLGEEAADLLFHLLVLLRVKGVSLGDIAVVLEGRHLAKRGR